MAAIEVEPTDRYGTRRWWVHLGLMTSFAVAVLVVLARMGVALHILAGLAFAGLIGAHLVQRRRTVRTLTGNLARPPTWRTGRGRLALADGMLAFLAANVIVSGVADWASSRPVMIGLPGMAPLNWHTTTSLLLIVYLPVHVVRRRARLRHSRIR
jgi:hypothetical protein